jgi:hypothetical protein
VDADKVGRGATSEILQIDESPYISWIGITLPAALGSTTAARENAKRNGTPYGVLYTTTAGKVDSRDGRYIYDRLMKAARWNERFYDAGNQVRLEEMIRDHAPGNLLLVNCTFSHRQLGYTDEWLWETMGRNAASGEAAERDYLNRWTNGTGSNPISGDLLKIIAESEMDPQYTELTESGYIINWYIPKDKIERYMESGSFVIGLDTSDAIGRDGIAMQMIDVRSRAVVASGQYNRTSIVRWISFMGSLMLRYPNTLLIPERKSSGQSIMDGIVEILDANGINPFQRIFNSIVNESQKYAREFAEIASPTLRRRLYETHKHVFGFMTTGDTRNTLYVDVMQQALTEGAALVRDKTLSAEFRGLMVKNGRIDHTNGGHDDNVIAYLLANWVLSHGKNLSYYGINTRDIRSEIRPSGRALTPSQLVENDRQRRLKEEVDVLCRKLEDCDFEFDARRIETQLRFLMSKLSGESEIFETINDLIEQAAGKRQDRLRTRARQASNDAYPNLYDLHRAA